MTLADCGRNPRSREIWRARRNFVFFVCQVSNAQFYRFPVGQILPNLNTTRRSVSPWILSEQNFENVFIRGSFFPKKTQKIDFLNVLRLQAAIIQWSDELKAFVSTRHVGLRKSFWLNLTPCYVHWCVKSKFSSPELEITAPMICSVLKNHKGFPWRRNSRFHRLILSNVKW